MADVTRLVSMSRFKGVPLRPTMILDLEQDRTYAKQRDTFQVTPPAKSPRMVTRGGRYGGSRAVGERQDNGSIGWTCRVFGATRDAAVANVEALLAQIEDLGMREDRFVEWRPEGSSRSAFFEVRGPGTWTSKYSWTQFSQGAGWEFELTLPVAPLARSRPMDFVDLFTPMADSGEVARNLISNPSSELTASVTNFSASNAGLTAASVDRVTTWSRLGQYSSRYQVQRNDGATLVARTEIGTGGAPVVPGQTYAGLLSFLINTSGTSGTLGAFRARIYWFRADGSSISAADGASVLAVQGMTGDLSAVGQAPSDAAFASVALFMNVGTGAVSLSVCLDAFQLSPLGSSGSLPEQFDGSSDRAAWLGDTHASPSVRYARGPLEDYTVDAGAGSLVAASYRMAATDTTLKQARLTGIHPAGDNEVLATLRNTTTAQWTELTAMLCALDKDNYLYAGIVNGTLRIGKCVAGVRSSLVTSGATTYAPASAPDFSGIRARQEGNAITVEFGSSSGTVLFGSLGSLTYTLDGADAAMFGAAVVGASGFRWTPNNTNDYLYSFEAMPFTYRSRALPARISLQGAIPGTAPALMDFETLTPAASPPAWVVAGWGRRAREFYTPPPLGPIKLSAVSGSSWAAFSPDAGSLENNSLRDTTPTAAESYLARATIWPQSLAPDDFSEEILIEFWCKVILDQAVVTPRLAVYAQQGSDGPQRYSEFGSAGRVVPSPSAAAWRLTRLGTISLPVNGEVAWSVTVQGMVGGSGGSVWGVDYVLAVPIRRRVALPSGKANDSSYPKYATSTSSPTRRIIRSNGTGLHALSAINPLVAHRGVGGVPIEPQQGQTEVVLQTSSMVPDDPTVQSAAAALITTADMVHFSVTPRYRLVRA